MITKRFIEKCIRDYIKNFGGGGKLTSYFIFGYGSLMYPWGVNGRGMRHTYKWPDLQTASLDNFQRGMFAGYNKVSFYGILPNKDHSMNGAIFQIHTRYDRAMFLLSEGAAAVQKLLFGKLMYKLTDVTPYISGVQLPENATVFTLVCDKDNGGGRTPYPQYQERVWLGIQKWGPDFLNVFQQTGGIRPRKKKRKNVQIKRKIEKRNIK